MSDSELRHPETAFEKRDVNFRGVVLTGFAVVVGVWIASFVLYFFFGYLTHRREYTTPEPLPLASRRAPPTGPRLQATPRQDLQAYEAGQDFLLSHYMWVNKQAGTVAIPIERAIELTAERGIPPQKTPAGMELSKPSEGTRLTGTEGKSEPEPR